MLFLTLNIRKGGAGTPADILNEQSRKGFWAKVKASKPYFMTDTIISDVEALALQCNIPLTD